MAKETLTVDLDLDLIERVRRYSEAHGTDVAGTIGELIASLPPGVADASGGAGADPSDWAEEGWIRDLPPLTRSLLGAAAGEAGEEEYREYLWRKYGS